MLRTAYLIAADIWHEGSWVSEPNGQALLEPLMSESQRWDKDQMCELFLKRDVSHICKLPRSSLSGSWHLLSFPGGP